MVVSIAELIKCVQNAIDYAKFMAKRWYYRWWKQIWIWHKKDGDVWCHSGDLMVEIEVVVVDIFHKKNRKRYTGVISRPQYIMISKIPLPSMCITTNQLLHLFCIHRIRDICFSIFQSLILSWYCQLTFKKIVFTGAISWFNY